MPDDRFPDPDQFEALPFRDRVLRVVSAIPAGRLASYGDVPAWSGAPRAARGVGATLDGTLEGDGVAFHGDQIRMEGHRWRPDEKDR